MNILNISTEFLQIIYPSWKDHTVWTEGRERDINLKAVKLHCDYKFCGIPLYLQ